MVRLKSVLVMFFVTFNLPDIVFTRLIYNLEVCLPSVGSFDDSDAGRFGVWRS